MIDHRLNLALKELSIRLKNKTPLFRDLFITHSLALTSQSKGLYVLNRFPIIKSIDSSLLSFFCSATARSLFQYKIEPFSESLAWTIYLPTALVLGIWASDVRTKVSRSSDVRDFGAKLLDFGKVNATMIAAFLIGSLGSILAGIVSITLTRAFLPGNNIFQKCISCLTAGYIGGTINFYETADLLGMRIADSSFLVNGIAALDIAFMVIYFTLLRFLQSSSFLSKIWTSVKPISKSIMEIESKDQDPFSLKNTHLGPKTKSEEFPLNKSKNSLLFSNIVCILSAISIATFAQSLQSIIKLPGISVMISVLLAFIYAKGISNFAYFEEIKLSSHILSSHFMDLFYVTIGLSCDLYAFLSSGFQSIMIMVSMLTVHVLSIFTGCYIWNVFTRILNKGKGEKEESLFIDLDTVILASNACVGGASTAAAMAGTIGRPDLIAPASTAGIVGYLIGTSLGLLTDKMSRKMFL